MLDLILQHPIMCGIIFWIGTLFGIILMALVCMSKKEETDGKI